MQAGKTQPGRMGITNALGSGKTKQEDDLWLSPRGSQNRLYSCLRCQLLAFGLQDYTLCPLLVLRLFSLILKLILSASLVLRPLDFETYYKHPRLSRLQKIYCGSVELLCCHNHGSQGPTIPPST